MDKQSVDPESAPEIVVLETVLLEILVMAPTEEIMLDPLV